MFCITILFGAPGPKAPVSFAAVDESCCRSVHRDRSDVARIFANDDYRIVLIISSVVMATGCNYFLSVHCLEHGVWHLRINSYLYA